MEILVSNIGCRYKHKSWAGSVVWLADSRYITLEPQSAYSEDSKDLGFSLILNITETKFKEALSSSEAKFRSKIQNQISKKHSKIHIHFEKSRIRETKNLSTYADSSTAAKKLLSIYIYFFTSTRGRRVHFGTPPLF